MDLFGLRWRKIDPLFFVHVRWMHKQSRYRFQVGHNGTLSLECVTELKGDQGGMEQFKTRLTYTFAYIRRRSLQGIPIGLSFNERLR